MATIQTSIMMADNITATLHNIINALSMTTTAFQGVQDTASRNIDANTFEGIMGYIGAATDATQQFQAELDNLQPKTVPVEVVPVWNTQSNLEIFQNTGVERLSLEMGSLNDVLNDVLTSQQRIGEQALNMELLPQNASWDINLTNQRIEELGQRIAALQDVDVSFMDETSVARYNAELESIRSNMNNIVNIQEDMGAAIEQGDFSRLNAGYGQLNNIAEQVERRIRSNMAAINELNNIEWRTPQKIEIFDNNGIERFKSEISNAMDLMDSLSNSQTMITEKASGMRLLPSSATADIEGVGSRIAALRDRLQELSAVQLNGVGAEQANAEIEHLRQTLYQALQIQEQFSGAMGSFDVSGANNAFNQLNSLIDNTERNFRDRLIQIQEMDLQNAKWATPQTIDIIIGSGFTRYEQEMQSANGMLDRLADSQQQIGRQSADMRFLPPAAVNDLNLMSSRVQALRNQIEQMQNTRIHIVGVEQANVEMEALRQQLNQALETQEALNNALTEMDVSAANNAYNRLNAIVDSTERNIRDNTAEQQRFNQELRHGGNAADGLQNKIMGVAAAYMSVQGIKSVLDLSDTSAQTAARLKLIVDDGGSVNELQDKIFLSAQSARADYQMTSDVISKLGMQAGNAFNSNDELIAFAEQLNKTFKIAGTDASGIQSTMYNLTQALSSGVLRGQDLNSVFSNAQPIIQNIADYLGVSAGEIRDMAADGQLSADVVKNAMLMAADATNEQFEKIPQTFGEIATEIKNNALMAFQPILTRLNDIANSSSFQTFAGNAISGLVMVAGIAMMIFTLVADAGGFIVDNWSLIAPVVFAVAAALGIYAGYLAVTNTLEVISKGLKLASVVASYAKAAATGTEVAANTALTASQWGLNTALLACPLTWIILAIIAIIAVIYIVVAAINKFTGTSISATGIIFGAFAVLGAHIYNGFVVPLWNQIAAFINFFANVFNDPVAAVKILFFDLAKVVLDKISVMAHGIETILNKIPGVHIDITSGLDSALASLQAASDKVKIESDWKQVVGTLDNWQYQNTWQKGYTAGENLDSIIANFDPASLFSSNIPSADDYANYDPSMMARDVASINSNTSDMKAASEEDLKYLRDIAERETINRFTLAEIKFDMGGVHNNVNSTMDLDGIADYIGDAMMERLEIVAEGVYA